jgi:hypothetical protein
MEMQVSCIRQIEIAGEWKMSQVMVSRPGSCNPGGEVLLMCLGGTKQRRSQRRVVLLQALAVIAVYLLALLGAPPVLIVGVLDGIERP